MRCHSPEGLPFCLCLSMFPEGLFTRDDDVINAIMEVLPIQVVHLSPETLRKD